MPLDVLFISNGHGEDLIAARIAQELGDLAVAGFPLVGHGESYLRAGISLVGPRQAMPSGGFVLRDAGALAGDLKAGLGRLAIDQLRFLTKLAAPRMAVAVGDMLPVAATLLLSSSRVLIGCNKTDYYTSWGSSYLGIELAVLKWAKVRVYPRDTLTHQRLAANGISSISLGNPMMDGLDPHWPGEEGVVGVLPGSRPEAFDNFARILPALEALGRLRPVEALLAAPPSLDPEGFEATARAAGWDISPEAFRKDGLILRRDHGFADVLRRAQVVLGLAGTANEQAVGCGRPVIAFAGNGPQYNRLFAKLQAELLGSGLHLTDGQPEAVAQALAHGFAPETREAARLAGAERMGEPGAAARIAASLRQSLDAAPLTDARKKAFTSP